jgi:predicted permease
VQAPKTPAPTITTSYRSLALIAAVYYSNYTTSYRTLCIVYPISANLRDTRGLCVVFAFFSSWKVPPKRDYFLTSAAIFPNPKGRELANVNAFNSTISEAKPMPSIEIATADFRYAARQLRRSPGFALTVILTLALGIGGNLAIFQLLHAALFSQLPIAHPDQLYSLQAAKSPFDHQWLFSTPAYRNLRASGLERAPIIARSGISQGILVANSGSPSQADFQMVSDNFFEVLGLSPAAGRFFLAGEDDSPQSQIPVVLRYGYWKQSFGSNPAVVGTKAILNGVPTIIVGVAPDHFSGVVAGAAPDLWLPLAAQATGRFTTWFDSLGPGSGADIRASYQNQQSVFWLWLLARVPDAGKLSVAGRWTQIVQPDLALLAGASKDLREQQQILQSRVQLISAATGEGTFRSEYSQPLILLMAMAALVLVIGCVNLANLQLVRLLGRQRELTVRATLGASRWRLVRQLLAEDLLLALLGLFPAVLVSRVTSALLLGWTSTGNRPIPLDLRPGWEWFAFGVALFFATLLGFSVLPAWRFSRSNLAAGMTFRSSSSASSGRNTRKWSSLLLVGQVSFSLLLLGVAALFAETLLKISRIDAGLDREHVLSVHLDFTNAPFAEDHLPQLYARLLTRLKELPAVRDAAISMCAIPGCIWNTAIHVAGHPEIPEPRLHGEENHVGANYFHTLGIPVLRGREFDERDLPASQPVAIVSHGFAKNLFGSENPIGHRIGYQPAPHDADYLIVGEVADARLDDLRSLPSPIAYFSLDQRPAFAESIEVRANGQPAALFSTIRQLLLSAEPNLPVHNIVALSAEYDEGLSKEKLLARLTAIFGLVAMALAALGFYGLLSFNVAARTSEIGIRIAVGATPGDVRALLLRETLAILAAGIVPGVVLTEIAGLAVRNLLYNAGAVHLAPLTLAAAILITIGVLATLRPARRAARVDPISALRAD